MDLDIDTVIETDPEPTMGALVRGGLCVTVDGQRLNAYVDEHTSTWPRSWYPEYVGEIPLVTLGKLFQTAARILRDEERLYDTVRVPLPETGEAFLCEYLGGESLRVAFQTTNEPDANARQATPKAARGFIVPAETLATELLRCGDEVTTVLDRLELDDADVDRFRDRKQELRTALNSHRENTSDE